MLPTSYGNVRIPRSGYTGVMCVYDRSVYTPRTHLRIDGNACLHTGQQVQLLDLRVQVSTCCACVCGAVRSE